MWDYVGDNFVHRLLQNKGDGKLVEGGAPAKDDVIILLIFKVKLVIVYPIYFNILK